MTITISEDNSYNTLDEVKAYCVNHGLTLPADDEKTKAAMLTAMDFIESHRDGFKGCKAVADQPLQFPRVRVRIDAYPVDADVVPTCVKWAHCRAAYEVTQGTDLQPVILGRAMTKDTTGPLGSEFSEAPQTASGQDVIQSIMSLLKPVMITGADTLFNFQF